jgi:isoleucyl-tRNA synthetase
MLGPILVHTAEEAWDAMEFKSQDVESVHLADMPKVDDSIDCEGDEPRWQKLMGLRDDVLRVLEGLRQEKQIASNQQACVTICCDDEDVRFLNEFGLEQFAALCIVSEIKIVKTTGETTIVAEKSSYTKCQRCWNYWPSVGANSEQPDLCERCVTVVRNA